MDGRRVWGHLKPGWSPDTLDQRLHVPSRRLPPRPGDRARRVSHRVQRVPGRRHDPAPDRAHRPDRPRAPRPLPLARPRRLDGRRRPGQAVCIRGGAERDRRAPTAGRACRPRSGSVRPGCTGSCIGSIRPRASIWCWPSTAPTGSPTPPLPGWPSPTPPGASCSPPPPPPWTPAAAALTAAGIPESRITAITTDADAHPASALATAASAATAEHLLLMQAPAIGLTHDWLTRLLGYSDQAGIAAAGPVLLAPDGRIQQAGIAIPDGIPLHLLHGQRSSMDKLFGYGTSVFNVSAVSGVLCTPRGRLRPARRPAARAPRPGPHRLLPAGRRPPPPHRHRPRRAPAHHWT